MSDLQNHVLHWLTFQASVRRSGHAFWHNKRLLDVSQLARNSITPIVKIYQNGVALLKWIFQVRVSFIYIYSHTCIHTYIHTYVRTYIHIFIYHISLYHCFYIHVFPRPFEVILASGFTLCYCAMAVQQLPLQESFSLSIGATVLF